MNGKN